MTCGARPLISPHVFKRSAEPDEIRVPDATHRLLGTNLLATHSGKRNCVVQVVCECGGSRPDLAAWQ